MYRVLGGGVVLGGGSGFREACVRALEEFAEEIRRNTKSVMPITYGNVMFEADRIIGDVVEAYTISCEDRAVLLQSVFGGVLSKAKSMGQEAYIRLLEALLKSNYHNTAVKFVIDDGGFMALLGAFDYRELEESGGDISEEMKGLVVTVHFIRFTAAKWVLEALERLERGEAVEPLDLEKEVERLKESRDDKGGHVGILPFRF